MTSTSQSISEGGAVSSPRFRRVLHLQDLILYGMVLIMSVCPPALFGVVQKLSDGHAATTILLSMIAMMLTAFSYGRMATCYPSAGSAYTYVGRALHPHLGFLAGWAMLLDYLLIPLICTIYGAVTMGRLIGHVPYIFWAAFFAALMTVINLRGIRATMTANFVVLIIMTIVVTVFVVLAIAWLMQQRGWGSLFSIQPFYRPAQFHLGAIATGTSVAALTYGGFDGVTTLAEDVENPRKNLLIAIVLVCFITGIFTGLQVYLAQLIWPDFTTFPNVETAFMDVAKVVGGPLLFLATAVVLIIASFGSGLSAQAGVSRLLFGMGRDGVLPTKFFAYLHPRTNTPIYSVLVIGLLAFLGALILNYERAAELINFGAFLAFMGVNISVIRQFYVLPDQNHRRRFATDLLIPGLGFLFCLLIWCSLPISAKAVGGVWFAIGVAYHAVKTRGFRRAPVSIDFSDV